MTNEAKELFEKHWTKATGKPIDEMTIQHMSYAIDAIDEALGQRSEAVKTFEEAKQKVAQKYSDEPFAIADTCQSPIGDTGDYNSWIELVAGGVNLQNYDGDERPTINEIYKLLKAKQNEQH